MCLRSRTRGRLAAVGLVGVLILAACGDDDGPIPQTGVRETTTTPSTTTTTAAPTTTAAVDEAALDVLVTNDDGFDAAGIDALVEAVRQVEGVTVTVVAPAGQQSGTGGDTTPGPVATGTGTTASGFEVTTVEGFPADAVRVALEDLGLQPDLVLSGINEGQNLGPIVDVSGTVGAARAAVRAGVPALAVSAGVVEGTEPDYAAAVELALDWLAENRAVVAGGGMSLDAVPNLNVPTCTAGEGRGLLEVEPGTDGDPLAVADCESTAEEPTDDIGAFTSGYATLTLVPVEPDAAA